MTITAACVINALRAMREVTCEREHREQDLMKSIRELCTQTRRPPAGGGPWKVLTQMPKALNVPFAMSARKDMKTGWFPLKGMGQEECFHIISAE